MTKIWHLADLFVYLFMTREEVPLLDSDRNWELERRRIARQAEPGGLEELWGEGFIFINIKIVIKESHHLVVVRGAWQKALDFTAIVGKT